MNVCVCTINDRGHKQLADFTHPRNSKVCRRLDYTWHAHYGRIANDRPLSWSKLLLISRLLLTYDVVLYIDTDVLLLEAACQLSDHSATLESRMLGVMLPQRDSLITCQRQPRNNAPNGGILCCVSGQATQALLYHWFSQVQHVGSQYWEQAALEEFVNKGDRRFDCRPYGEFCAYPEPELAANPPAGTAFMYHHYGDSLDNKLHALETWQQLKGLK